MTDQFVWLVIHEDGEDKTAGVDVTDSLDSAFAWIMKIGDTKDPLIVTRTAYGLYGVKAGQWTYTILKQRVITND